jgi:hypothetical protein
LRDVTRFPVEWISELAAEGLVDVREYVGGLFVRLRPAAPA